MGIETIIMVGLTAFKAVSAIKQGNAQAKNIAQNAENAAKATIAEGNIAVKNKAQEIRAKAARQTSSFLNSGLTLEGTPDVVIGETFSTGLEDLDALKSNYDQASKNIINNGTFQAKTVARAGRSEAIDSIVSAGSGMTFGSMGSMFTEQAAYGLNSAGFGNTAYNLLDKEV